MAAGDISLWQPMSRILLSPAVEVVDLAVVVLVVF